MIRAAMAKRSADDLRLAKVTKLCLGLPEAERRDTGDHATFLVRKKVFAYYLNDHHGDGKVALCAKLALGENADRAASDPARFYLPAYIGPRGWVAMRLDVGAVDWDEAAELLHESYRLVAPKRLASLAAVGREGAEPG